MKLRIRIKSGVAQFRTVVDGIPTAALDLPGGDYDYEVSGDIEVEELDRYVTVQIISSRISKAQADTEWTYRDPYGDLQVGDFVRVPFGRSDVTFSGRVSAVDTGDNGLAPWVIKTVAQRARFE